MTLNDWPLGRRLGAAFAVLLIAVVVMAAIGSARLARSDDAVIKMTHEQRASVLADRWKRLTLLNHDRTAAIEASGKNAEVVQLFTAAMKTTTDEISAVQKEIDASVADEPGRTLLAEVARRRQGAIDAKKAFLAASEGEGGRAAATLDTAFQAYIRSLSDLSDHEARLAEQASIEVHQASVSGSMWMWVGGVTCVLLGTLFAALATRSGTRPVARAVEITRAVAAGDLSQPIELGRRDEVGRLLAGLHQMQQSLAQTVGTVRLAADSITSASSEIATGNHDLSSRTEHAASNLQQTAASMEQLLGTVRQNTDDARTANNLASAASGVAQRGSSVVSEVVAMMSEIADSSNKIADIIGVIDSIAFQTNILALNAAVEAARAGEQGRGFAVVAAEVRSLAQRSAEAAREIKSLISSSVERVDAGSRRVRDAGDAMQEIVQSVQHVGDIITKITGAATKQSDGIGQVNHAVSQLDEMTHQNAALVEQSAAAAQSLKGQAQRLSDVVRVFQLSPVPAT